jgi:hypothetical protein
MSADNWEICPQCLASARRAADARHAEAYAQYGKVSVAEFDALRADLAPADPEDYRTFREDYEFYGADEGEVTASYGGGCTECGLNVELKAHKRFYPEDA